MEIEVVRLTPLNAHLLDSCAPEVFDAPIVPTRVAAFLAEAGHLLVVAVHDAMVVGQLAAIIHHHPDQATELYIENLGVAESVRRRGIARRLIDESFAWGREHGCEEAWIGTEPDNTAANALYARLGAPPEATHIFVYSLRT